MKSTILVLSLVLLFFLFAGVGYAVTLCNLGDTNICNITVANGGNLTLNWIGYKNFTVNTNTVTINKTSDGNHSAYNSSSQQGLPYFQNVASGSITVNPNEQITCGISSASGGCDYPYEDNLLSVQGVTTNLCAVTINCADANGNGCLRIGTDNQIINGLGTIIKGTGVSNSRGIGTAANYQNITIQGINISNFNYGIRGVFFNSTIQNNSAYNTYLLYSLGGNNNLIQNNYLLNASIYAQPMNNSFITSNRIICTQSNVNTKQCGYRGDAITFLSGANNNITNNNVTGALAGAVFLQTSGAGSLIQNFNIWNNVLDNNDEAIVIRHVGLIFSNINISGNTLFNNSGNGDTYNLGLEVLNTTGVYVDRNTFSNLVDVGIYLGNVSNINITRNSFIFASPRSLFNGDAHSEAKKAIAIKPDYKGWNYFCPVVSDRYTSACEKSVTSNNIYLSGNTFDLTVPVYLEAGQVSNLQQDFTNDWYRKETWDFLGMREFYVNSNYNFIYNDLLGQILTYDQSYKKKFINWSISTTQRFYLNLNNTETYNLSLFNLTDQNGLPCTQVFLLNGTTTPLLDACTPNGNSYNVTVTPNNRSFVFSYTASDQPKFATIDSGINTLSYSRLGNTLTISCTGTGNIGLQNMLTLKGSYSFILHKRNGVVVDYFSTDTYTQIGCSDHTYTATNDLPVAQSSPVSNVINQSILAVLVAVFMVVAVGYPVYKNYEDWSTKDWLKWLMISLIVVLFGIIIINNIFAI